MTNRHAIHTTRRQFGLYTAGLVLTGSLNPALAGSVALSGAETTATDAAEREIAELGNLFRQQQPDLAAQLEAEARTALRLPPTLHRAAVRRAFPVLTDTARVAEELQEERVVFVNGWLLAHSEATAALLFAAADTPSPTAPTPR